MADSVITSSVTGEANFSMRRTSLTVGGFNQPAVARSLIELPGNAEKGLSQRFLWLFPKPVYGKFDTLEPINKEFTAKIGKLHISFNYFDMIILCSVTALARMWRKAALGKDVEPRIFYLPRHEEQCPFTKKYNEVQEMLQTIATLDDLVSG